MPYVYWGSSNLIGGDSRSFTPEVRILGVFDLGRLLYLLEPSSKKSLGGLFLVRTDRGTKVGILWDSSLGSTRVTLKTGGVDTLVFVHNKIPFKHHLTMCHCLLLKVYSRMLNKIKLSFRILRYT